jgi:hypothetical protein
LVVRRSEEEEKEPVRVGACSRAVEWQVSREEIEERVEETHRRER